METVFIVLIIVFLILAIIVAIVALVYLFSELQKAQKKHKEYEDIIQALNLSRQKEIEKARQQSVATSRNTIKGQIAEQMAPLLTGFSYLPSDSRFIGDPIDYIVFNGYTDFRESNKINDTFEVVILDVKHNTASLTQGQKAIGRAIEEGRVRFEVVRILQNGEIEKSTWNGKKVQKSAIQEVDPLENIPNGYKNMFLFLQKYPKAYEPWDDNDDVLLRDKYENGMSISDLAKLLKRNPGRVQARVKEKVLKRKK